jgi:hypothetical protein
MCDGDSRAQGSWRWKLALQTNPGAALERAKQRARMWLGESPGESRFHNIYLFSIKKQLVIHFKLYRILE